jgi:(p)ppGpp synthase/HD superfamily hydrolase
MQVMKLVFDWGAGTDVNLCAAACHDILGDTDCPAPLLEATIGKEAAAIVKELTFFAQDPSDPAVKAEEKLSYLATFKEKSVSALVIKLADRHCNVHDFARSGDIEYARKYFRKASPLVDAFAVRTDEVRAVYGSFTVDQINLAVAELFRI